MAARKLLDSAALEPIRSSAAIALQQTDADCHRLSPTPANWELLLLRASPCGAYRYQVGHRWAAGPLIMFLLMNPSGADGKSIDATLRKTARWAAAWGFGGQLVANACAYRATKSGQLKGKDAQGPDNITAILEMAEYADMIVVAHGDLANEHHYATAAVAALKAAGHTLYALKVSARGIPYHPMARGRNRLPDDLPKPTLLI